MIYHHHPQEDEDAQFDLTLQRYALQRSGIDYFDTSITK